MIMYSHGIIGNGDSDHIQTQIIIILKIFT